MEKKHIFVLVLIFLALIGVLIEMPQTSDLTKYDKAIVCLPDGEVVVGKMDSVCASEDGQMQIEINGTTYLVNDENVAFVKG